MKKMLVFMLVLGLASTAGAMTLQISVADATGQPLEPVDSEVWCVYSENLWLDIENPGVQDEDLYVALVVDTTTASVSGGTIHIPPAGDLSSWFPNDPASNGFPGLMANENGVWGSIAYQATAGTIGVYVDEILFHCNLEDGDAIVRLLSTSDFSSVRVHDTLTIHQIPEPMTIALLGLGGLALLRRRK